jgi:YegS/Rv2252/BmrU family lipid kinase
LLVNPSAGGGRAAGLVAGVEAALRGHGYEPVTHRTTGLDDARTAAGSAAEAGRIVVTLGGDGLVGAVADVLSGTDAVLGVLPGGRGNDFVRSMGIPMEAVAACAVIAAGKQRPLDVGDVDGRAFIGIASCGFDSEANRIANEATIVRGNLVYAYAALRALATWKPARFELELDGGERVVHEGYTVACANGQAYGGGMFLAPDASLEDGLLDLVLTGHTSKLRFLRMLPRVFKGEHVQLPEVRVLRTRSVRISSDRPFALYADGDPIADLPATVTVRERALHVLVP